MQKQRLAIVALALACRGVAHAAPALVEYPGHPATYGDHTINAMWSGGPASTVLVEFQSNESILHDDGVGQSQRTARNTLTYVLPSSAANPQDHDDLSLIARYGPRLPLLQQLSANGTSVLTYRFPSAVTAGFDLFVTDLDSNDAATVRAFGLADAPIDMTTWRLAGAGDLSLYKNTGAGFSSIVAPTPTTLFQPAAIQLTAVDATNYNRTYSILRAPVGSPVERVEIQFTGTQNSPNRAAGGNGSHIYHALTTLPNDADFNDDGLVDATDLVIWQGAFNLNQLGDADGDNDSDGADFLLWQQQLATIPPPTPASRGVPAPGHPAPAVPEPGSLWLAAVLGFVKLPRRRPRTLTILESSRRIALG